MWLRAMSDLWGALDQKPAIQCGRRGRVPWSMGLHISGRPATLKSEVVLPSAARGAGRRAERTVGGLPASHAIVTGSSQPSRTECRDRKGAAAEWGLFKKQTAISARLACLLACLRPPPSDSIHAFSACFVVEPQRPFPSLHWIVRWGATCKRWKLPGKRNKIHASQARRARQVLWSGEIGMAIGHHQFAGLFGGVVGRRSGLTLRMSSFLLPLHPGKLFEAGRMAQGRSSHAERDLPFRPSTRLPVWALQKNAQFWTITSRSSKSFQLARVPCKFNARGHAAIDHEATIRALNP